MEIKISGNKVTVKIPKRPGCIRPKQKHKRNQGWDLPHYDVRVPPALARKVTQK